MREELSYDVMENLLKKNVKSTVWQWLGTTTVMVLQVL